ncbi:hypothetical protein Despr_1946 [Desulfobulbus propionicus DSM 2032]|uniref:Uncharacterized protein n=1 Tax=Desulfobulbus propionicus (strain ATCC 33891 / DSM 2032 / VKM B-1956 / 1pr3) TaxID=577650 RepID=A0A7U3YMH2_DESPD|nr:hypothetical protein [Desulfobulbus propionicus]ADW18094.1 hypothetical protein Despr_1946 [Desulfobulbus propionicus DSM 2032]
MTGGARFSRWRKPGARRSVHLFAAPLLWTLVGGMLVHRGWAWMGQGSGRLLIVVALALGTLKSLLILDGMARRSIRRIILLQDGTCLGAVYSWQTWLLVALMAAAGFFLRWAGHPGPLLGMIYCAIGWSLCLSSRLGWRQWIQWVRNNEIA